MHVDPIKINSGTIYVISDLHMAAGNLGNHQYAGTENFFSGAHFNGFIAHLIEQQKGQQATIIINGDFVDFIRIKKYPSTATDIQQWLQALSSVGIKKTEEELVLSVSEKEKKFGLRTND